MVKQDERERLLALAQEEVRDVVIRAAANQGDAAIHPLAQAPLDGTRGKRIAHAVRPGDIVQLNDLVLGRKWERLNGQAFVQVKDGDSRTLPQQDDPLLSSALTLKRCLIRSAELGLLFTIAKKGPSCTEAGRSMDVCVRSGSTADARLGSKDTGGVEFGSGWTAHTGENIEEVRVLGR